MIPRFDVYFDVYDAKMCTNMTAHYVRFQYLSMAS